MVKEEKLKVKMVDGITVCRSFEEYLAEASGFCTFVSPAEVVDLLKCEGSKNVRILVTSQKISY